MALLAVSDTRTEARSAKGKELTRMSEFPFDGASRDFASMQVEIKSLCQ
jgi:hypothetical protein